MLLAGLQGQDVAGAALGIRGTAHKTAGKLAHNLLGAGHEAKVGAAEGKRHAEALSLTHGHIRAHLAGGLHHGLHDGVDGNDRHGLVALRVSEEFAEIADNAEEVRVLHHHAGGVVTHSRIQGFHVACAILLGHGDDLNGQVGAVRGQHGTPQRMHTAVDNHLLAVGEAAAHGRGFKNG